MKKKYIGSSKFNKFKNGGVSFPFYINNEELEKYVNEKENQIQIHFSKKKTPDKKGFTHSVYVVPKEQDPYCEAILKLDLNKLRKLELKGKNRYYLLASSKKESDKNMKTSELSVKEFVTGDDKNKKPQYVGNGFLRENRKIIEYAGVGQVFDFKEGRAYHLYANKESLLNSVNENGFILVTLAQRKTKGKYGATHSLYLRKEKSDPLAEINISLNAEKIKALKADDKGMVKLNAFLIKEENIKAGYPNVSVKEYVVDQKNTKLNNYVGNGYLNYDIYDKNRIKHLKAEISEAIRRNDGDKLHRLIELDSNLLDHKHQIEMSALQKQNIKIHPFIAEIIDETEKTTEKQGVTMKVQ